MVQDLEPELGPDGGGRVYSGRKRHHEPHLMLSEYQNLFNLIQAIMASPSPALGDLNPQYNIVSEIIEEEKVEFLSNLNTIHMS